MTKPISKSKESGSTYTERLINRVEPLIFLSSRRNAKSAKRFLGKALRGLNEWEKLLTINTDKAPAYSEAIRQLKKEGKCPKDLKHRQIKYLNNRVEADHGKLKRLINPVASVCSMADKATLMASCSYSEYLIILCVSFGLFPTQQDKLIKTNPLVL